ncbi:MAG: hypothetical protein ACUVWZ_13910, partial [Anaerolineae bacterium]
ACSSKSWHVLVALSLLTLVLVGHPVESQAGWIVCPPVLPGVFMGGQAQNWARFCPFRDRVRRAWRYGCQSWHQPFVCSLLLGVLWGMGRRQWTFWIIGWLWVLEEWQTAVVFWPEVSYQPVWRVGHRLLWQGQRVLIVLSVALALKHAKQGGDASCVSHTPILSGIGCQYWGREEPWVEVKCDEGGSHQAALCGHLSEYQVIILFERGC